MSLPFFACGCASEACRANGCQAYREYMKGTEHARQFPLLQTSQQSGWVCPRCSRVNAPFIPSCGCSAAPTFLSGFTIVEAPATTAGGTQ